MKNVQIIDDAINASYDIYQFTDEEFAMFFPGPGQNIEFADEAFERIGDRIDDEFMNVIWSRRVDKENVHGIHGTLFYGLPEKKKFYPDKTEPPITGRIVE